MDKINFTWLPKLGCNYRCPYCFLAGRWDEDAKMDKEFSKDKVIAAWSRMKDKYGECSICISGGEPTLFPNFFECIDAISKMHSVGICTNLSVDISKFIDLANPVALSVSYHPHFADASDLLNKLSLLKRHQWELKVEVVGWPPLIPKLDEYCLIFQEYKFSVLPFWGKYNEKNYPIDYSEEEKKVINKYIANRDGESFKTNPPIVKGRLCRAGQVYANILPNGEVTRCSFGGEKIGRNFFDADFKLLDRAHRCYSEHCGCLEWVVC